MEKIGWFWNALISGINLSVMVLCITYLTRKGLSVPFVMLVMWLFFVISFGIISHIQGSLFLSLSNHQLLILAIMGITAVVLNITIYMATRDAPNPGLAMAIQQSAIIWITLSALFVFGGKLNPYQILWISLILWGLVIINVFGRG